MRSKFLTVACSMHYYLISACLSCLLTSPHSSLTGPLVLFQDAQLAPDSEPSCSTHTAQIRRWLAGFLLPLAQASAQMTPPQGAFLPPVQKSSPSSLFYLIPLTLHSFPYTTYCYLKLFYFLLLVCSPLT